ncbi:hypothetical protein Fot_21978 [Forsythia ovata]|uniref:Uncharacterized protein n=1 Tax=Forsythia ovata TaxID=205694 RepID=A0ABD1UWD8_9LAMI
MLDVELVGEKKVLEGSKLREKEWDLLLKHGAEIDVQKDIKNRDYVGTQMLGLGGTCGAESWGISGRANQQILESTHLEEPYQPNNQNTTLDLTTAAMEKLHKFIRTFTRENNVVGNVV